MKNYIEWIGTGSGLNPVLGNTSFLVGGGERTLLVDCGCTVPLELIKSNKLKQVTDVIITHAHADHIGGLEVFAFMNYFAYRNREDKRPNLYVATDELAHNLWHNSLKGGMQKIQADDGASLDTTLETFFSLKIGKRINIADLPSIELFPTLHVKNLENYGLRFDNGIFYSGDTVELPPHDPRNIFQDCQFFETESDVHISYNKLLKELPVKVRAKTYLVHLNNGWDKKDCKKDGFAGFVMP